MKKEKEGIEILTVLDWLKLTLAILLALFVYAVPFICIGMLIWLVKILFFV